MSVRAGVNTAPPPGEHKQQLLGKNSRRFGPVSSLRAPSRRKPPAQRAGSLGSLEYSWPLAFGLARWARLPSSLSFSLALAYGADKKSAFTSACSQQQPRPKTSAERPAPGCCGMQAPVLQAPASGRPLLPAANVLQSARHPASRAAGSLLARPALWPLDAGLHRPSPWQSWSIPSWAVWPAGRCTGQAKT